MGIIAEMDQQKQMDLLAMEDDIDQQQLQKTINHYKLTESEEFKSMVAELQG